MTGNKQATGLVPVRAGSSQVGSAEEGAGPAARSLLKAGNLLSAPGPGPSGCSLL